MEGEWILSPFFEYLYCKIDELSSITPHENIALTASYYYLAEDTFKCHEKEKRIARTLGKEKAKQQMETHGISKQEPRFTIDGINFHKCVCQYRSNRLGFYLDLLDKQSKGILPFEGSYLDQPAKLIEIINRLDYVKTDIEARRIQKQQKEQERKNR